MNAKTKRTIASRMLLAIFLPMLLLSSLHIHPSHLFAVDDDCTECVNHHCGGHIAQQTLSLHDCVLCQFLTLPMVMACAVAVAINYNVRKQRYVTSCHIRPFRACDIIVTRGPPATVS